MRTHDQNERIYLLHVLKHSDLFKKVKPEFFKNETLKSLFKICAKYYERFRNIPDNFAKTLKTIVCSPSYIAKHGEQLTTEDIDALFSDDIDEYAEDWRVRAVEAWIKIRDFEIRLTNGVKYIKTQDLTPDNADDIIRKTLTIFNDSDIKFGEQKGVNFFDESVHRYGKEDKIISGYVFVDRLLNGGYEKKTLITYIGQSGVGKSIFLCRDAAHFVKNGYNVVYVSAEMSEKTVLKRIGSMLFNIPIREYENYANQEGFIAKKIDDVMGMGGGKIGQLKIVQMADPTVIDIESYVTGVEKEIGEKIDVVICDYIGIMSNYRTKNNQDSYTKIKEISKDLRDIGMSHDWLMISASQIGKEHWDSSSLSIKAIAESSALVHNCDLIYGIIQDPDMQQEDVYWLKVLKIRDGEGRNTKCKMERNSRTLAITETDEVKID